MNKKKIMFLCTLLSCFILLSSVGVETDKIKTFEVTTANYMINAETPMNIPCNGLEQQFICARIHIDDKKTQEMILGAIKSAVRVPSYDQTGIDTRLRINILYESGKTIEVCFSSTSVFMLNGEAMMLTNTSVKDYLFSLRSELGESYSEIRNTKIENVTSIEIVKDKLGLSSNSKSTLSHNEVLIDTFFIKDIQQQKLILKYLDSARSYLALNWNGLDTIKSTVYINYKSGITDKLNFGSEQRFYLNRRFWKLSGTGLLNYLNNLKH